MTAARYIVVFVAGVLASILVIEVICSAQKEVIRDDCKALGQFRIKQQAFKCEEIS